MSDLPPRRPLANGGMSRNGATSPVMAGQPEIDTIDKKVLCSAMCQCDKYPDVGKDGKQLKQVCVAGRFKVLDKLLDHRSPYKQEINYDMSKTPPSPILDGGIETKGHDYLPGWIKKYWDGGAESATYKPGIGAIRRPDIVIVKDPTKPPTQDNIKQIVEMKFPPDSISATQAKAYVKIAGVPSKLRTLVPADCDCDSPEPDAPKPPIDKVTWAATAAAWLAYILTHGRTPRPPAPAF